MNNIDEEQFIMAVFECACVDGYLPRVKETLYKYPHIIQNPSYIKDQIENVKKQIDKINEIDRSLGKYPRNTENLESVIKFLEYIMG